MILLNPKQLDREYAEGVSKEIMLKTVAFFESRGKSRLKRDDHDRLWYADFLKFIKEENIFSTLLTPAGLGDVHSRWDTWRICEFNEILGFYGLNYWYTWQVSMLGLGPIWMSQNEELKQRVAKLLKEGNIFAFGLSEKEHGADLYSSEMSLEPQSDGTYKASGKKYYIGNGNEAVVVSTFGKFSNTNEYVFFAVDSHHKNYKCIQNIVNSQNYVAEYVLDAYPIEKKDIISMGQEAWDSALNTVNICKFNLGWASIGMCTHAFYEAIDHASSRRLFGRQVTDFPHVQQLFVDAYARLVAMKLFSLRAADYMRSASSEDRRYLLYNSIVKMKVTTQGEEVVNDLWDIIAAKGFEKNMQFETVCRDIRALPKLEGTVHVNMALIIKFMKNYFFNPKEFNKISKRNEPKDDNFLFNQGATQGLGKVYFHDYRIAYHGVELPNIEVFKKQIKLFKLLLFVAKPTRKQTEDFGFLLVLGELFTLIAYGQLIIENSEIYRIDPALLDQIFDFIVRDFSQFAVKLYSNSTTTRLQMLICKRMLFKPCVHSERFKKVLENYVYPLKGAYSMNPGL